VNETGEYIYGILHVTMGILYRVNSNTQRGKRDIKHIVYTNIDQTLVNSLHRLLNFKIGG